MPTTHCSPRYFPLKSTNLSQPLLTYDQYKANNLSLSTTRALTYAKYPCSLRYLSRKSYYNHHQLPLIIPPPSNTNISLSTTRVHTQAVLGTFRHICHLLVVSIASLSLTTLSSVVPPATHHWYLPLIESIIVGAYLYPLYSTHYRCLTTDSTSFCSA